MNEVVIAMGATGALLACVRIVLAMLATINHAAFNAALRKLLAAGNRERASKLAGVVPRAVYARVAMQLLDRSRELSAADGRGMVSEALRETLERAVALEMKPLLRWAWLGWLAAGLAVAAAVTGHLTRAEVAPSLFLPAAVALLVIAGWRNTTTIERGCRRSGAALVDALTVYVLDDEGVAD